MLFVSLPSGQIMAQHFGWWCTFYFKFKINHLLSCVHKETNSQALFQPFFYKHGAPVLRMLYQPQHYNHLILCTVGPSFTTKTAQSCWDPEGVLWKLQVGASVDRTRRSSTSHRCWIGLSFGEFGGQVKTLNLRFSLKPFLEKVAAIREYSFPWRCVLHLPQCLGRCYLSN